MDSKKTLKAKVLAKKHDQLADHDEVRNIIREELLSQLEGQGFWDSFKNALGAPAPVPHPATQGGAIAKPKRKTSPETEKRYAMIRKLMKGEGISLPEASKRVALMMKSNKGKGSK